MAENKNSFLLYTDIYHTVKKLTDDQAGKLFKHILSYVNDENPVVNDMIIDLVFEPIKQNLKRDLKRYEAICLRNKDNGSKGGRPKAKIKKPRKPSGLITNPDNPDGSRNNPENPDEPDNDNDIDNDNVNDIEEIREIDKTWLRWKEYKKKEFSFNYKSEISETAAKKELIELSGNNEEIAIKIIEQSITHGWKGFFKLKINGNGTDKKSGGASNEAIARIIAEKFGSNSGKG
jgi:hypothetical protein